MSAGNIHLEAKDHVAILTLDRPDKRNALEVIRKSPDMPLEDALALELEKAVDLVASGEFIYGVSAFLEKKPPEFPE